MVELAGVGGWSGGAERGASATSDRERYQEKKSLGLEKGYIYIYIYSAMQFHYSSLHYTFFSPPSYLHIL